MEDVLDVSPLPYDPKRPVVCFDETRKTLHDTPHATQPARPAEGEKPARLAKEDYGYARNGSARLCLGYEPRVGTRGVSVREQHLGIDITERLRRLSDEVVSRCRKDCAGGRHSGHSCRPFSLRTVPCRRSASPQATV